MTKTRKSSKTKKGRGSTIKLVVKSNELVEARYMFDVWETRFFHSLIACIKKTDEDDKVYRLWFKDMKKNFQLRSNQSYEFLREAAISMAGKSVYIGWQNDKFRRGRMHRIIRFVDYLEKGQKGDGIKQQEYVDVSIDKDIRPYLLDIKKNFNPAISRYTSYDLRNIIKLKPYATRIYELFKQLEYKGFRTILLDDLREMFEITNEYPRFSNLYQKVISPSIIAINKYTDITIPIDKIEKIKKGRKVHALRFMIITKTQEEVSILRGDAPQRRLFDNTEIFDTIEAIEEKDNAELLFNEYHEIVVHSFGMTASTFLKILKTGSYKREDIEQAISVTRRAKYKQEIKKTVAGFFRKALENAYTDLEEETKKSKHRKLEQLAKMEELETALLILEDEKAGKINEKIRKITSKDDQITLRAIHAIKENHITQSLVQQKEKKLKRELEVEDYRSDETLRTLVISNIIQQEAKHFNKIVPLYDAKIEALKTALKKLKSK